VIPEIVGAVILQAVRLEEIRLQRAYNSLIITALLAVIMLLDETSIYALQAEMLSV
jgi:hypothetical protein